MGAVPLSRWAFSHGRGTPVTAGWLWGGRHFLVGDVPIQHFLGRLTGMEKSDRKGCEPKTCLLFPGLSPAQRLTNHAYA